MRNARVPSVSPAMGEVDGTVTLHRSSLRPYSSTISNGERERFPSGESSLPRLRASERLRGISNRVPVGTLALRKNYDLDVLELRTGEHSRRLIKNIVQEAPTATSTVDPGDVLFVRGPEAGVELFATHYGLQLDTNPDEARHNLRFYDIGVAEIVPMPDSPILKQTIAQLDFRNRFNVNVLGVRRGGDYITENLGGLTVRKNDVLLVQGPAAIITVITAGTVSSTSITIIAAIMTAATGAL